VTAKRVSDYGVKKGSVRVYTGTDQPTGQDKGDVWVTGTSLAIWNGTDWIESGGSSAFSFFLTGI
jgi:hypothetical protein